MSLLTFITFGLFSCTDSFAKLNSQSEFRVRLVPTVRNTLQKLCRPMLNSSAIEPLDSPENSFFSDQIYTCLLMGSINSHYFL